MSHDTVAHDTSDAKKDSLTNHQLIKGIAILVISLIVILCIWVYGMGGSNSTSTQSDTNNSTKSQTRNGEIIRASTVNSPIETTETVIIDFDTDDRSAMWIGGKASIDDGVCIIENGKVIQGNLPRDKEYWKVTPISEKISIIIKKNN